MISGSNEQLQQQLEYSLLKPDCQNGGISKMQSGHEDTLEEGYAIKFCFKLGKNDATEMYGMLQTAFGASCMNRASVFEWHKRFKEGRDLWGMMRGVGGVKKSEHLSWLDQGLGLLCWGFKGVQEEIPSEEASTLQIGSVAFPPGQCTSPQLHSCHRLFDQDGHQGSPYSPDVAPCDFWLFPKLRGCRYETIEEMKEALMKEAVMKEAVSLTHSHKRTSMGPSRSCWNGTISALQPRGDYFEGD